MLREQGLLIIKVSTKTEMKKRQALSQEALINFTIQLSQLLGAGIPLYESLLTIEEQTRQEPYHRVLLSLCNQVKSGVPLSSAMSDFKESFSSLYRAMITAGESVGSLEIVLDRLSFLLKKQMKLKNEITTAMIYPGILALFSLIVISLLIGFVVPSIEGIFEGRELNRFTTLVLGLSKFLRTWWWLYLPLIASLIGYTVLTLRSPKGQLWMERTFLKVPFIKKLMIQAAIARFCRTLGTLLQGGLPLIEALKISRQVMRNVVLEEEVKNAESKIIEGRRLSQELSKSSYFPPLVARMLAVGEDSGTLVNMLNRLADMYEDELEKSLTRVTTLAQPVILIFMGVMIGMILLAILLPLTDISSIG
jgi:general secretion pathway protein F/type IV pilus assembly protein PilC